MIVAFCSACSRFRWESFDKTRAPIAAVKAWAAEKAKPIDQILLEQRALTAETHALVAALMQRHLEIHENDAVKVLAALSSVGSVWKELAEIADVDVQATVDHAPKDLAKDTEPTIRLKGAAFSGSFGRMPRDWESFSLPMTRNCSGVLR